MKITLSLILALVMCLGLCACGGNGGTDSTETNKAPETTESQTIVETAPPIETISFDDYVTDIETNAAKAQLNVGKCTTVFGQVTSISIDYCNIKLFRKNNHTAKVYLPTEVLAEMNTEQIIAVSAIIESVNAFKADELSDLSLLGTYISDKISAIDANTAGSSLFIEIRSIFNMSLLYDYLQQAGASYCSLSDSELKDYLLGKWFYDYAEEWDLEDQTIEYKDDGTYIWKFNKQTSALKNWVQREQDGDWSVTGCSLKSVLGGKVYVLSQNAYIANDMLYTRIK